MVGAAPRSGNNVINREIAKRECYAAAVTNTFLQAEKGMLLRPVMRNLAYVGAPGNVLAMCKVVE